MKYEKTLVIAEAGVNHNGNLSMARKLIEAAADAGADLVKFQSFKADRLASTKSEKADYQKSNTDSGGGQLDMLRNLELDLDDHLALKRHCDSCGIRFFSTAFDLESLDMLHELGLEIFKIPSGEITNLPYLRRMGTFGKPIILSTGMANLGEIEAAIGVLESTGTPREEITILHCNTEYPTPMCDVNLRAMETIHQAFGVRVGYSDHTLGIEIPIAAVALGAVVIEKHLTLDRSLPGPDHAASLEPGEFKAMVRGIRNIEIALGDGLKRPSSSEQKNMQIVRKSLVAGVPIIKDQVFNLQNIAIKRAGKGISPMLLNEILGRRALRDFNTDEAIEI
jgi:N,N'-diacetyllegionaminate synthase